MSQFHLRPYHPSDAKAVVEIIHTASILELGFPRAVMDGVGNIRHQQYVPVSSNKVVAVNDQNKLVGYAYLADKENGIVMETSVAVHPSYWGQGIGQLLLAWTEEGALGNFRIRHRAESEPFYRSIYSRMHHLRPNFSPMLSMPKSVRGRTWT